MRFSSSVTPLSGRSGNFSFKKITYEDALTRYKLALLNAVVRQGKNSEKAFICLKTAWLLRGMRYSYDIETAEGRKMALICKKDEREYLLNALEGRFLAAVARTARLGVHIINHSASSFADSGFIVTASGGIRQAKSC